jgi:hypothetical protein
MRYRFMATYRGIPYEAGVGPSDSDIVLFAACPPPEELGFQPATGHWRKAVTRAEVDAVWESKPSGVFGGEPCLVLDELGDQLHIGYPGHDPIQAERLGYCEVEPGVFEVLVNREDVAGISEERVDRPYPVGAPSWPANQVPPWPAGTARSAATEPAWSDSSEPAWPASTAPAWPAPVAMAPVGAPPGTPLPSALPPPSALSLPPLPPASALPPLPPASSFPPAAPLPPASSLAPAPSLAPVSPAGSHPSLPPTGSQTSFPPAAPMTSSAPVARMINPVTISPAPVAPAAYAPVARAAASASGSAASAVAPPVRRRHHGSDTGPSWAQTRQTFTELANLAAIPPTAYAVNEAVDGAICLMRTDTGFEVFSAVDGTRQEIRLFADEEAAYFYMFGLLTAEAVRDGRLIPPR